MSALEIRLFGEFAVTRAGSGESLQLPHAVQALFAYLVLNRKREHPRDDLLHAFWPEEDPARARSRLNTALWRLRKALSSGGVDPERYILARGSGEIAFNRAGDYWLDVEVFEEICAEPLQLMERRATAPDPFKLEDAIHIYQGEALRGFYDDWAVHERERLQSLYVKALTCLMSYHREQGAFAKAIDYGRLVLAQDPLREDVHRDLIRLYAALGQRALALQQYKMCKLALELELDIAPMVETEAALKEALTGRVIGLSNVRSSPSHDMSGMARDLRAALDGLARAEKLLGHAHRVLERIERKIS